MLGLGIGLGAGNRPLGKKFSLDGFGLTLPIWYDFSIQDGAHDSAITDVSNLGSAGSTYNLTQTVASQQPLISTSGMGEKSASFDNTDDYLKTSTHYDTAVECTMAFAFKLTNTTDADAALSGDTFGANRVHIKSHRMIELRYNANYGANPNSTFQMVLDGTELDDEEVPVTSYTLTANQVEVLVIRKDGSNNVHVYNKNGDKVAYRAGDTYTDLGMEFAVMGIQLNTNVPFGGFIGEAAMFNGEVTQSQAQEIAVGLRDKWS
jgi:hypothetical protein